MVTELRGPRNFGGAMPGVAAAEPLESNDDGTFEFPPVLEGDWSVRAVLRSEDRSARSGAAEVRVSKNDIENLEIHLTQPFEIEVTADWGDPPPAAVPPIRTEILPLDGPQGGALSAEPGKPQRLKGFAGRYFIGPGFSLTPGYYAAAAMLNNRDVLGQVVEIAGPASLRMIYKAGGGSVRGTVEHGADVTVVLMADDTPAARLGFTARCDAEGGFAIRDVPPGSYTVGAVQEFTMVASPEFQNLFRANGKRVTVEAGASAQVELKVMR